MYKYGIMSKSKKGSDSVVKKTVKDDRLIQIIKDDSKLAEDIRIEFLVLARSYLTEFKDNLSQTSLELDAKYGFGADTWRDFLQYPSIKKYIDGFMNELIAKNVDQALISGNGTRDAIGVKREMARTSDDHTNEMFVIFRMPDKEEIYETTGEI